MKLSPSRTKTCLSEFVSRSKRGTHYPQQASRLTVEPMKDPESMSTLSNTNLSNRMDLQQQSVYPQGALSYTDPVFIRTVTTVEFVCDQKRYKCSGCLRYYDHLSSLLGHIEQGWTEGFSCRVFYQKLKSMQKEGGMISSQGSEACSTHSPQLSSVSLTVTPAHTSKACRTTDKKMDMIWKWLQTIEIRESE